jgi:hypothetical protein
VKNQEQKWNENTKTKVQRVMSHGEQKTENGGAKRKRMGKRRV